VQPEYLDAARRTIDENYGGLSGYLEAAGVTADGIAQVRAALLG
jgi:protein-tyrosine phosphatase